MLSDDLLVDRGVLHAIGAFMVFGLEPGSFTTALMLGDLSRAYMTAHPNLFLTKSAFSRSRNIVSDMGALIADQKGSEFMWGTRETMAQWMRHSGFKSASDIVKSKIILSGAPTSLLMKLALIEISEKTSEPHTRWLNDYLRT